MAWESTAVPWETDSTPPRRGLPAWLLSVMLHLTAMLLLASSQGMMSMYRNSRLGDNEEHFIQIYRNTYDTTEALLLAQ